MALHVAHFDLAGGKLVATQDQDELGAYLIGLLKLGLERTTLIVGLGHDTCGAKLLRNGKDVLTQLLAGVGDIDARGLIGTQIAAKGLQGQQGALKTDSKADSKGLAGIFFMALTLVLVSFSCTGPIVGSVLIKSTSGEFWSPIVTMLAFSVAFALPFTVFAFFPSMLKKLPKSGGWLNSVKVVLGFIEVALGMKFLSVADQTYHWGLLDREIYLAVWIVTFSLLGLYLLGKIKFAHDSDMPYLGVGRLALAIVTFSFVVYLVPGMWGAPLKGLSGYLPPLHTQDFVIGQQDGSGPAPTGGEARMLLTVDGQKPKHSDFLHLPHNLEGFFDLKEAEAYAAKVGKPLFIDFTGHGCVNCREMEARVWSDPQVLDILRNDYVIVALYSDDKKVLPESEWVTTDAGKVLKSLGKINSYYALKTFGVNAQPYYVLQGRGGKELVPPRGYDLDVQGFVDFLRSGVEAYDRQK